MKKSTFTESQIVAAIKKQENGMSVKEVSCELGISDEELLSQFRKVEMSPANKKKLVKEFLDAFIFKADLQK